MQLDYLRSADGRLHAINVAVEGATMEAGILCVVSCQEQTIRITDDTNAFVVELPTEFRSGSERVKAFNAVLTILSHEQV